MNSHPLKICNVVKSYGEKPVLNGISFDVEAGEFIVLVGPSGCGKSTMLRSIAGLETVNSGQIVIGDQDVTTRLPKDRDIAMVFQDYALYPHKTVYENIAFGLRIRKDDAATIDKKVKLAAQRLDLEPYLERKPLALSGGQRQRVAIGRAIVRDPKAFLFDEPLSNLDAKLRGSMRHTISKLHKDLGTTSVYVTHDQIEAMTLADKIIVLDSGHIQQMGTPLDLYYHPSNEFVATFIGSPSMNLISGQLRAKGGDLLFESESGFDYRIPDPYKSKLLKDGIETRAAKWGLRPENLRFLPEGGERNASEAVYKADVSVTEPLGPTTSVLCEIHGHEVNVNIPEPHRPQAGDQIELEFSSKHLYLFDQKTGLSLL